MSEVLRIGREPDPAKRIRQAWGKSIRQYRKLRGWSLDQMALEMGGAVTAAAIGMWERGETAPRWHHQALVAKTLQVPHSVLFNLDEAA